MPPTDPHAAPLPSVEEAVRKRYAAGARAVEPALCCPVDTDRRLLEVIPAEVVERDYGCGDPTRHLREGEVVLDLGSGTGKACFMAAQVVGPKGRVIGVDMTDEMLEIARRNAPLVAERLGFDNVEIRKGRIQDLGLDLDALEGWLAENPVRGVADLARLEAHAATLRRERPLVASGSVDVVVSNCVLNLVEPGAKRALFAEILRVLRPGGRAVISDIVSDRDVPERLQADPELWSGCISGAFREDLFLRAFEDAGFVGVTVLERQARPWQVVEGLELRSVTVAAWRPPESARGAGGGEVIYRGPFREVKDDSGNVLRRGERASVSAASLAAYRREPYATHFDVVGDPAGAGAPAPRDLPVVDGGACCGPSGGEEPSSCC